MKSINIHRLVLTRPLINSSCVWASSFEELTELYRSPFTGAVTTRTATFDGFVEHASHTVAFTNETISSLNSYGYSPHPLSAYLTWVETIIQSDPKSRKPFIISITAQTPGTLTPMLDAIQALRSKLNDTSRIAIELNTSCPNIRNSPPPSYDFPSLMPILSVLSEYFQSDLSLTFGLKLPPYVYAAQFDAVIRGISSLSFSTFRGIQNPIAFITSTNTLGSSLLFSDQTTDLLGMRNLSDQFAVPTVLGGLAGEHIHALSLGNVYTFTRMLTDSPDEAVRRITVIGVGGVTSPEAVKRMMEAGAKVVGCATILGREGVAAFGKLAAGLK